MTHRFGPSCLTGQFVLSGTGVSLPERWLSERIGGWLLGRHRSLPVIRMLSETGRPAGWLLGYPIDGTGRFLADGDALRVPGFADGADPDMEKFVYDFGGRFLAVFVGIRRPRLYLDPVGSLSVVYCAHQEIVASTPNLIPYDSWTGDRVDLASEMGIPFRSTMYPLGLTPRNNIERLLPNHYLDLSNWQSVRHWPKQPLSCDGKVDEAVAAIASVTKRNIASVVSRTPTYLRLTAGQDSRMMLSCARGVADRIELFTVPRDDDKGVVDTDIARKIARRFGLHHFVLKRQKPSQEDLDEYMFRISYSVGEVRGWQAITMYKQTNPAYAHLVGNVGEVGRATLAMEEMAHLIKDGTEKGRITPEVVVEYCGAPRTPLTLGRARQWLETVPAADAIDLLDIFYIEQRLGCWGGIFPYAHCGDPGFIIFPMCHREIIERMLTLPKPYRRSEALMRDVIDREWPELMNWPFNKPMGMTRMFLAARRNGQAVGTRLRRAQSKLEYQTNRVRKAIRDPRWALERVWHHINRMG